MTRSVAVLFGAALALIAMAASGEEGTNTANTIMPGCRTFLDPKSPQGGSFREGLCAGIVSEIVYVGRSIAVNPDPERGRYAEFIRRLLCLVIPAGVSVEQEVRVVVAYVEARPGRMHEDFRSLALEALRTAWPADNAISSTGHPAGLLAHWVGITFSGRPFFFFRVRVLS